MSRGSLAGSTQLVGYDGAILCFSTPGLQDSMVVIEAAEWLIVWLLLQFDDYCKLV